MTTNLSLVCGYVKPDSPGSDPCQKKAIDSSGHCYSHSPLRAEQRKRNSSKGGRLGGRGRSSISKEIKGVRELTGLVIELKAQNRLPDHIGCHMKDFVSLLKLYSTLVNQEVRTSKAEELEARHAYSARQLIDTGPIRAELEDLVYGEDEEGYETQDDPA